MLLRSCGIGGTVETGLRGDGARRFGGASAGESRDRTVIWRLTTRHGKKMRLKPGLGTNEAHFKR
jgi:hypothetical protein